MRFNLWKDYVQKPLPDVLSFIVDNRGKTVPTDINGNHQLIATNCIRNENLYPSYDKVRLISEDIYSNWFRAHPEPGDIIFVNKGTPGRVCMVPDPVDFCIAQDMMALRVKNCEVYNKYLLVVLRSRNIQSQITSTTVGDVIPHFKKQQLKDIKIPIPPMNIQRIIGDLYFAFCYKIEQNKKINDNLEQQALALFRHYFMNFEPYGGVAPSNWTEVSLDDVCARITDGSHYSPSDVLDAPYPMYSVKDMETYGFNSSSCKHITGEEFLKMQKNDCVPRLNDILVAKDGSYLKEIFICSEEKDEAILSSIAIFRPNTEIIMPEILLYLLKQPSVRRDVGDNYVSGSALPRIVLKDFKKYAFLLPPMEEQIKIGSVLHAIRMQTKANIDEIQSLSALRDTLLPRLMSGELDVSSLNL